MHRVSSPGIRDNERWETNYKSISACVFENIINLVTKFALCCYFISYVTRTFGNMQQIEKKSTVKMWVLTIFIYLYKICY